MITVSTIPDSDLLDMRLASLFFSNTYPCSVFLVLFLIILPTSTSSPAILVAGEMIPSSISIFIKDYPPGMLQVFGFGVQIICSIGAFLSVSSSTL